jgi:molybdopterin-guanine dinucleotide biosynthesis protein A
MIKARTGVILAGGKSTRFGGNKAFVEFREKPLIYWVAQTLSQVTGELVLSIASAEDAAKYLDAVGLDAKIAVDFSAEMGPIAGLLSSFSIANGDYVAVAPCDTPFVKPSFYEMLFSRAEGKDGAVVKIGKYYEPLLAVYRRKPMIKAIKKVLSDNKKRPIQTYKYLDLVVVKESEVKRIDPALRSLVNINTISELRRYAQLYNE